MFKKFSSVFILLLLLSGCTSYQPVVFANSDFRIEYPSDWILNDTNEPARVIGYTSKDKKYFASVWKRSATSSGQSVTKTNKEYCTAFFNKWLAEFDSDKVKEVRDEELEFVSEGVPYPYCYLKYTLEYKTNNLQQGINNLQYEQLKVFAKDNYEYVGYFVRSGVGTEQYIITRVADSFSML